MSATPVQVVVAGHICLDVIPAFGGGAASLAAALVPGKLVEVGPAVMATGGAVSNAGLALHRLGTPVALMGKVGDDLLGQGILDLLRARAPQLADGMIVLPGEHTSYTVVISPPGTDRVFLHSPGANDTFSANDIDYDRLAGARLFHFGYPPIMHRMFADGGLELASILRKVKERGLITSLDMALPDPASPAGQANWMEILARALPDVDLFIPSFEETLFMLDRERFVQFDQQGDVLAQASGPLLSELADRLLDMGVALVALKLGDQGLYLRTTAQAARLSWLAAPTQWRNRELLAPCFAVEVAGTTGSGDCTVAGFIANLLRNLAPEAVLSGAVAVGACSVEQIDACSGVPSWESVQARIATGWERRPVDLQLPGWQWSAEQAIWRGPNDSSQCLRS